MSDLAFCLAGWLAIGVLAFWAGVWFGRVSQIKRNIKTLNQIKDSLR